MTQPLLDTACPLELRPFDTILIHADGTTHASLPAVVVQDLQLAQLDALEGRLLVHTKDLEQRQTAVVAELVGAEDEGRQRRTHSRADISEEHLLLRFIKFQRHDMQVCQLVHVQASSYETYFLYPPPRAAAPRAQHGRLLMDVFPGFVGSFSQAPPRPRVVEQPHCGDFVLRLIIVSYCSASSLLIL